MSCLGAKKLRLNKKSNSCFANNFIRYFENAWLGKNCSKYNTNRHNNDNNIENTRRFKTKIGSKKGVVIASLNVNSL